MQLDLALDFGENGRFGLTTWGTPAEFDDLKMGPLLDFDIPEYIKEDEDLKPEYEEVGNFHEHDCTERRTKD